MSGALSTSSATDTPAWPGYPDAPRPSFAAPFVPAAAPRLRLRLDPWSEKYGFTMTCMDGLDLLLPSVSYPSDPWATPFGRHVAEVGERTPNYRAAVPRSVRERWTHDEYVARGRALILAADDAAPGYAGALAPDAAGYYPRRGLTPTLRAEVHRRDAAGEVPVTHLEVARPTVDGTGALDVELAEATPDEQAEAAVRLAEEAERRYLTAAELRARFAPSYAFIKAMAKLVAARAEAERVEVERAATMSAGASSLVDQILAETEGPL